MSSGCEMKLVCRVGIPMASSFALKSQYVGLLGEKKPNPFADLWQPGSQGGS